MVKAKRTAKRATKPKRTNPSKRAKPAKPKGVARPRRVARPAKPRAKRAEPARNRSKRKSNSPTGAVVQILDADRPIVALREFLAGIDGELTIQQGQIALGAAQLMLLPVARNRGRADEEIVRDLIDLVLGRWADFPERTGFHAQELLRNAFAAIGDDRDRLAQLSALVPADAAPELRINMAAAHAVAGDRTAMLRAVEAAIAAGANRLELSRDPDLARFASDEALRALLDRSTPPPIPVDVGPHLASVRAAIDALVKTLREFGETVKLEPPATLDTIAASERTRGIQLPNDYRALLSICDGMTMWDHSFFGTIDFRSDTKLARSARESLETLQMQECIVLASWGQPNDWLVYDPYGNRRGGEPGILLIHNADEHTFDGVVAALEHFEAIARDVLGAN